MSVLTERRQQKLRSQSHSSPGVSHVPLPHDVHHCLNIKTNFRKKQEERSCRVSMTVCVCEWLSFSVYLFFNICMHKSFSVCISCMCVQPLPHSIQLLFCDGRRTCSEEGEGFLVRKRLFDSRNSGSSFCQKAKNIRKRTFLCLADVVGEVCPGTRGDTGKGRGKGKAVCFH